MHKYINPKTKQVFKVGEQIRTRDNFKNTLQRLAKAKDPVELFYKGDMMKEMVKEFKEHGKKFLNPKIFMIFIAQPQKYTFYYYQFYKSKKEAMKNPKKKTLIENITH